MPYPMVEALLLYNEEFYRFINQSEKGRRKVLTLGDNGTSSYIAAQHFSAKYQSDILLYPTYEEAAEAIQEDPLNRALIVANAYAAINRFYISDSLYPVGAFFKDTPPYVLAARSHDALDAESMIVATHPAPRHLIVQVLDNYNISIQDVDSTHRAAELVAEGKADACLTTQVAAELLGLKTLQTAIPTIPMLWTVFTSKEKH